MAANIIKELDLLGVGITLFPIGQIDVPEEIISREKIAALYSNQSNSYIDNDSLRIYHQNDVAAKIGQGRHFGYTTFELDAFQSREINSMQCCEKIITASKWGRDILSAVHFSPAYSPLGVDRNIFNEVVRPKTSNMIRSSKDNFVVLHIGKAEVRKGTLEIIEAFNQAFTISDDVELWLSISNVFLNEVEWKWWEERVKSPKYNALASKTKLITKRLDTQHDIAELISQADCGIFMSFAEGFNLPALEMMSCGKNVILTNYSGHTEFASEGNSWLVGVDETEVACDNKWFKSGVGSWAKIGLPQIMQAASHLQFLYKNSVKTDKSRRTQIYSKHDNCITTAIQHSWKNTAEGILKVIN